MTKTFLQSGRLASPNGSKFGNSKVKLNVEQGAPIKIRALVGNREKPEQRLEVLKQYYPDARGFFENEKLKALADKYGYGEDNFIYTDVDENGNETQFLYNPKGLDTGDIASIGRVFAETVGGAFGGTAALTTGPVGTAVGVGLGAEFGGQIYDRAMDILAKEYAERGSITTETIDAFNRVGINIVAPEIMQQVLKRVPSVKGSVRKLLGVTDEIAKRGKEVLDKAKKFGIDIPTLGQIVDSGVARFFSTKLRQSPITVDDYMKKVDAFKTALANTATDLAQKYGRPVKEKGAVGSLLKQQAANALERFDTQQTKLFKEATDLIDMNTKSQLPKVKEYIDSLDELIAEGLEPRLVKDIISRGKNYLKTVESQGGMSAKILLSNRTDNLEILRAIDKGGDTGKLGVNKANIKYLKNLNKALFEDMQNLFENAGGNEAKKAFNKAQRYTRLNQNLNIQPILNPLVDKTKPDYQAFNFAMQGSKESGERLAKVYKNLDEQGRKDMTASIIDRMGFMKPDSDVTEEAFNPNTFLKNFNNLSKSAKKIVFEDKELRENLDDLVDIMQQSAKMNAFENPSGTGSAIGQMALYAPIGASVPLAFASPTQAIGLASSAYLLPASNRVLMTNKKFINWLLDSGKDIVENPNNITRHVNRLVGSLAEKNVDPEYKEAVQEYIDALLFSNPDQQSMVDEEKNQKITQMQQMKVAPSPTAPDVNILLQSERAQQAMAQGAKDIGMAPMPPAPMPTAQAPMPPQGGLANLQQAQQFGALFPQDSTGQLIAQGKPNV